jgi:hypothetical protein
MSLGERDEGLAAEMTAAAGSIRPTKMINLVQALVVCRRSLPQGASALSFTRLRCLRSRREQVESLRHSATVAPMS